ncbi:MAG: TIGR04282 family arsenosugar biosynthesis glycosyltransferase [Myxococcota bacterium]
MGRGAFGRAVVVMGKPAVAGRVKTRLTPALSAAQAAEVYAGFLADVLTLAHDAARSCDAAALLSWAGPEPAPAERPGRMRVLLQEGSDLGERIETARAGAGAAKVVVIGSDAPLMDPRRIQDAFSALERGHPVVGPVDDGGYDLVGLLGPSPWATSGIPWSTDRVLEVTRAQAAAAGVHLEELDMGYDVDTAEDLARLMRDPRLVGARHTADALRRIGWLVD